MSLEVMLDRAIHAKDTNIPYLDELIGFIPTACHHEAVPVVQTALTFFRNCCEHLTDFFTIEGEGRRVLIKNIPGEQVFFSSDIRRPRNNRSAAPHHRIFMSVSFLDDELYMKKFKPFTANAQKLMYEQAQRYGCEDSEFLYCTLGLIHGIQQQYYELIDFHGTEKDELVLIFRSDKCRYRMISVVFNFRALLSDKQLLQAYDVDESQIAIITEDIEDKLSVRHPTYLQ